MLGESDTVELNFDLGIEDVEKHVEESRYYTVGDSLRKNARLQGDATAVVGEDGERITYDDLNERVNRLANSLLERGIDNGSTVALVTENRPELIEVMFAGAKIGALVPMQNWRLGRNELQHCLELTDPDAVVFSEKHADKAEWVKKGDEMSPELFGLADAEIGVDYELLIERETRLSPSCPSVHARRMGGRAIQLRYNGPPECCCQPPSPNQPGNSLDANDEHERSAGLCGMESDVPHGGHRAADGGDNKRLY